MSEFDVQFLSDKECRSALKRILSGDEDDDRYVSMCRFVADLRQDWDRLIRLAGEVLGTDQSLRNIGCVEACIELARKYLEKT